MLPEAARDAPCPVHVTPAAVPAVPSGCPDAPARVLDVPQAFRDVLCPVNVTLTLRMSITKTRRNARRTRRALARDALWPSWVASCLRDMPLLDKSENALLDKAPDEFTDCQAGRQPRRLDAGGVHDAW